ncbi:MAG: WG repeat-containing protein [Bacteroidaceae bacterium]|nr:WG repeat-containing protein [Bacteroidaceae bacterium]
MCFQITWPYKYDDIYNFSEGLAAVCLNDKWGYIDNAGKWGSGKDKH